MRASSTVPALLLTLALAVGTSGCTVIKPIACALVYPSMEFAAKLDEHDEDRDAHDRMPIAATLVAAPLIIPLNYVYYTVYGAVGGLVSGVVSDLNMVTGHGSLDDSVRTLVKPLRTNAAHPPSR